MTKAGSKISVKIQMIETIKHTTLELRRNISSKFTLHTCIHCSGIGIPSVTVCGTVLFQLALKSSVLVSCRTWIQKPNILDFFKPKKYNTSDNAYKI
jgi:hypothetical protein